MGKDEANMKFKELEFKYSAKYVSLAAFQKLCGKTTAFTASGYDYFYANKADPNSFCRHRVGADKNELTFKRKTTPENNYLRDEDNIELAPEVSREKVTSLCGKFGFEYAGTLFKNCFIYKSSKHTFVYYVCYNEDMNEVGRYIEIEMDEDYAWADEQEAWDRLISLETRLKQLGITAENRVADSLYEMHIEGRKNGTK